MTTLKEEGDEISASESLTDTTSRSLHLLYFSKSVESFSAIGKAVLIIITSSMAFLPTTPGLSFYSIPIAWILSLVPHVFAVKTYEAASSRKFDNTQPRSLTNTVASDQSLSKATKDVCPNFHNVSPLSIQSASARGSKMSMSTLYIRMVRTNKANSTPPPPDHHPRRRSPAERVREPRHLRRWRRRGQCRRLGRGLPECAEYGVYRQQGRVQSCVHQ